jgi:8-oxo-dGTP pyrophosphatase MutT (NUDIX family)
MLWLMQQRWRMTRGLTLGGQVCAINKDGRVLLVRHGYRAGWHFPGGGVEVGESVRDAALRELEEETGVVAREEPRLHGIFSNHAAFPGDHIALFVLKAFQQVRPPRLGFEIAEVGFYAIDALPAETTAGTRRRIAEIAHGTAPQQAW